jgi:hypothetical protein
VQDDKKRADAKEDSEGFSRIRTGAERPPTELSGRIGCSFCSPEAALTSENCRSSLKALGSNVGCEATSLDIRSLFVGGGGVRIRRAQSGRARNYF